MASAADYRQIIIDARKRQLTLSHTAVARMERAYDAAFQSILAKIAVLPERAVGLDWHRAQLQLIRDIDTQLNALKRDFSTLLNLGSLHIAQAAAEREVQVAQMLDAVKDPALMATDTRTLRLSDGVEESVQFGRLAGLAVDRTANRYYRDGLNLSARLYDLDNNARKLIEDTIIQGIAQQTSPRDLARQLETMLGVPHADNPRYKAMRIARTELNNAHREAAIAATQTGPESGVLRDYIAGIRWNLSLSHPSPDICVRRGTCIETKKGLQPIEEIAVGDLVLTHKGRFREVQQRYERRVPAGDMVCLHCRAGCNRNREVVLTPNHPVLTLRGWIPAGDLRIGDHAIAIRGELYGRRSPFFDGGASTRSRSSGGSVQEPPVRTACAVVQVLATRVKTEGECVYNLAVADDNSYIAGGFAVHNCDAWAAADVDGLGGGVYLPGSVPVDHPHGLCFLTTELKALPGAVGGVGSKPADVAAIPPSQIAYYADLGDRGALAVSR